MTRCSRLLRHPRLDDQGLPAQRLRLLGAGRRLLIALDGTEGPHALRRLVASVVGGCRGIPVQTAVFPTTQIPRSQNPWEHPFLRRLVHPLREIGQAAVLLCDRGVPRVQGLKRRLERKQPFVVRLGAHLRVSPGTPGGRLLRAWPRAPGQAVDLGGVVFR